MALERYRHKRDFRVTPEPKGKVGKLSKGGDARFLLSVEAILSVEPGAHVRPGDVLARIPMESGHSFRRSRAEPGRSA